MTKEEIRAVVISKLRLIPKAVVWDIGAGTGSVAVEAAILAQKGTVWAVEKNPEAAALIEQNRTNFGCENIRVVCGKAPQVLEGLPEPDRVFLGGSGGKLSEIVEVIYAKMRPGGIMVADFLVLENLVEAVGAMQNCGFCEVEAVQVAVTKAELVGGKHMLKAQNPVFVVSGVKV